jgi:hypothetical protein
MRTAMANLEANQQGQYMKQCDYCDGDVKFHLSINFRD